MIRSWWILRPFLVRSFGMVTEGSWLSGYIPWHVCNQSIWRTCQQYSRLTYFRIFHLLDDLKKIVNRQNKEGLRRLCAKKKIIFFFCSFWMSYSSFNLVPSSGVNGEIIIFWLRANIHNEHKIVSQIRLRWKFTLTQGECFVQYWKWWVRWVMKMMDCSVWGLMRSLKEKVVELFE